MQQHALQVYAQWIVTIATITHASAPTLPSPYVGVLAMETGMYTQYDWCGS
jgi:hypothetical protein